jgi:hypothetical protein
MEITIEKDPDNAGSHWVYYGDKYAGYTEEFDTELMLHFTGIFNLDEQIDILQQLKVIYANGLRPHA